MYSRAILDSCFWVPAQEVPQSVIREFTHVPRYENLSPVPSYRRVGDLFGFPRNKHPNAEAVIYRLEEGSPSGLAFTGTLRPSQAPLVSGLISNVQKGTFDQILVADTGSGKTVMLIDFLCRIGVTALIIVPKTDLMDQWVDQLVKFTGCPKEAIGIARQSVCEFQDKKVVVGMVHSLAKDKYGSDFNSYFGMVIFDELHRLGSPVFSKVAGMFPAKYRVGATATLSRSDGMESLFYAHLGKVAVKESVSGQPKPMVALAMHKTSSGPIPGWATEDMQRRGILMNLLVDNELRTKKLISSIVTVLESGRQTLVLSERKRHLQRIYEGLGPALKRMGKTAGFYMGETPQKERERVRKECDCILATNSMLLLGTDVPTARAMVFATPLANVKQAVGRIRRFCEGVKTPFIYDLIDTAYQETVNWAKSRERLYRSEGYEIKYVGVDYV